MEIYILVLSQINGKGSTKNKICHDPNIGATTSIAAVIRKLKFTGDIIITHHNITKENVDYKNPARSKFWRLANYNNIKLDGIASPDVIVEDGMYWRYDKQSEKNGTIFVHMASECKKQYSSIYENHGGCERGYFITPITPIAIPKKINNIEIAIPDLILYRKEDKTILLLEGKTSENVQNGINELEAYNIIEDNIININYPGCSIERWVVLFGDYAPTEKQMEKVIFQLYSNGNLFINDNAPQEFKNMIKEFMNE